MFDEESARDALLEAGGSADLTALADDTQICNCHGVSKGKIVETIRSGMHNLDAVGECCRAGTGCGSCQPLLSQLISLYGPNAGQRPSKNKIEEMKEEKDGLDCLPDVLRHAANIPQPLAAANPNFPGQHCRGMIESRSSG